MFGTRYHDAATRGIASGSNGAMIRLFGTAAGADYWFSAHTLAGFALAGGGTIFPVVRGSTGRSDPLKVWAFGRLGANAEGEFSTVTRSYAGKGEVRRA